MSSGWGIELLGRMGSDTERTFVREGSTLAALKLTRDLTWAKAFCLHSNANKWAERHLQGHQWQIVALHEVDLSADNGGEK
jgi:hypothetical protein